MIEHSTISRIMDTADIIEVVEDFVSLKKRGVNYIGLCPFHNEKTPSFTVSPSKGIFKCFGCGKGGNSVNFVMEHEHLSYPEALKFLAKKYHIEVEEKEMTPEDVQKQNERESMLVLTTWAARQFHHLLFKNPEGKSVGLSYFRERGFRTETLEKFELGYALDQWDGLTQAAIQAGYKTEFLVKTGLTIEKETRRFDRFSGRVIFPIHSLSGQVLGFGGRTLKKDPKSAKYLNSPESEIYHKSKIVYGIYQARKRMVQDDKCYLVEGYTDVLSMHEAGVENVVASSGTALTQEQIRLIKRFTRNITILYDGDEAGIKASLRGIDLTLEEGMNVRVVALPPGEDPDSYSKSRTAEEFKKFLDTEERDFIHFKTHLLMDEAKGDPVRQANMVKEIVQSISYIPESITRTIYIKESASQLEIQESVLHNEVARIRRRRYEKHKDKYPGVDDLPAPRNTRPAVQLSRVEKHPYERELVRYLLMYGHQEFSREEDEETGKESVKTVADYIVEDVLADELQFEHPGYKAIFEEFVFHSQQGMIPGEKHFTQHPNEQISSLTADILSISYELSKIWAAHENFVETEEMKLKKLVPDTLLTFKKEKINQAMRALQQELLAAQKEGDVQKMLALQERYQAFTRMKQELSKHLGNRIIL